MLRRFGPRQDDPDVLDAAGAVEFGVGGALVGGGGGAGDGDAVGDGGRREGGVVARSDLAR